jgi:Fe2+ transport system protein B
MYIEQLINKIVSVLPNMLLSKRFIALMILERNTFLIDELKHHYPEHLKKINKIIGKNSDFYSDINEARMQFIKKITKACFISKEQYCKNNNVKIHKLDHVLLNK